MKNKDINVAGRVFFHLVENKSGEYPFAFLATYSTETVDQKKAAHVPLKNALLEYKERHDLLIKLLSTVSKAIDSSDLFLNWWKVGSCFPRCNLPRRRHILF